ncbi:HK97 family phage prohead protease [Holosporaceae bacterium 'Namur']|nr:HK97 family phage prohead protease [Holosporaceae bacterium 'Namur']
MNYHYTAHNSLLQKSINEEGFFKGYASVFNVKDSHNDLIMPGAFTDSLKMNLNIKLLWQHDQKEPIGIINKMSQDEKGLLVEGRLLLDLNRAREAYSLITNQIIKGLSIGYTIVDYFIEKQTRYLTKLNLIEISLVTFPANKYAEINYIKSEDDYLRLKQSLERANRILVGDTGIEPVTSTMST